MNSLLEFSEPSYPVKMLQMNVTVCQEATRQEKDLMFILFFKKLNKTILFLNKLLFDHHITSDVFLQEMTISLD